MTDLFFFFIFVVSGDLATACQPLALRTFRCKIRGRGVVGRLLGCFRLALLAAGPVQGGGGVTARNLTECFVSQVCKSLKLTKTPRFVSLSWLLVLSRGGGGSQLVIRIRE
jgi:hypothetical protein